MSFSHDFRSLASSLKSLTRLSIMASISSLHSGLKPAWLRLDSRQSLTCQIN